MNYALDFGPVLAAWPELAKGALQTLKLSGISIALGLVMGVALMLMRASSWAALKGFALGYIEIVRNTPFLVQVFFIFFGLPALGYRLGTDQAAILALSLNCAAYTAEIIRGGLDSIHKGQFEAGRALGLNGVDIFRFVIFRPAVRAVYPALCSQFVLLMLTSSIVASISAEDLTYAAQTIDAQTFRSTEVYFVVGAIYLALSQLLSIALQAIGRVYFSYPVK
ncbi:amino acid ABC transporter permease [Bosea sp. 2RAB26]|uniref:amino acid ABC transporter permease n=1 Tax=Bosea sp. 2RAB26 TaxID=3237476 RepID=UPI003F93518C